MCRGVSGNHGTESYTRLPTSLLLLACWAVMVWKSLSRRNASLSGWHSCSVFSMKSMVWIRHPPIHSVKRRCGTPKSAAGHRAVAVNDGKDGAGDGTRTRDVQLGKPYVC